MEKVKLSDLRAKYPMYSDLSDDQFLMGFRKKFYSDISPSNFYNKIDFDTQRADPTEGMSTTEKVLAGAGKSVTDIGRSVKRLGNMVGIGDYTAERAAEDQKLDQPLMNTTAGKVGKFGTDIALTFVPGLKGQQAITTGLTSSARMLPRAAGAVRTVAPYAGAAGSGAVIGALTTPENMVEGAEGGAAAGALGEAGGRVLSAAWQGGKAMLDPLTEAGRQRVLKRTIERFAADQSKVRAAAANPQVLVPGVTPTLAEATGDIGIAQLQRAAQTASPDVANALAAARAKQVGGYRSVLDNLAGTDDALEAAIQARSSAADDLYGRARDEGLTMTPDLKARVQALMQRPSLRSGISKAKALEVEAGRMPGERGNAVSRFDLAKRSIDDEISAASRAGRSNEARVLSGTKDELVSFLRDASPAYGDALDTYTSMSRPINQMEIGRALRDKALPALTDMNADLARVNANSYAQALRNADATAAKATGLRSAKMADVLEPQQLQGIEGIGQDMARYAAAQEAGRVAGSPTAQYLGGQNVVRQFLGPLGLPQSATDAAAGRIASGLMNLPYKLTAGQTEQLLAQALTDPQVAAKILQVADPTTIAEILRPYAAQIAVQGQIQ